MLVAPVPSLPLLQTPHCLLASAPPASALHPWLPPPSAFFLLGRPDHITPPAGRAAPRPLHHLRTRSRPLLLAFRLTHLSPTFLSSLNPCLLITHVALTGSFLPQSRQYLPRVGILLGDRSHGLRAHSALPGANVCSSSGFSFPKSLPLPLHCPFFTARFKSAAAAAVVPVPAFTAHLASLSATWHSSRFSWCHGDFTQSCLAACKLPRADFIFSLPRPLAPADWAEGGP